MNCNTPGFAVLHHLPEFASLSPRVCSNSCPLSWWCHPTISSSVSPFSSCPQSFPASGSFPMSWLFASGGQSIEASAAVLQMIIQVWFPLGGLVWSPCCSRDSQESSPATKASIIWLSAFFMIQLLHPCMTNWKNHSFNHTDFCLQSDVSAF